MNRGFTLIELMIACTISAIMLTAVIGMLSGIWLLAKDASDELQGALKARSVRERLFYNLAESGGQSFGLISATNIVVTSDELLAQFGNGGTLSIRAERPADRLVDELDHTRPSSDYRPAGKALQYVYLAVRTARRTVYRERVVVPVFGRHPDEDEIRRCFGE